MAAAAGLLILDPDGRLLLLKRADAAADYPGHWGLPAGRLEAGETEIDAAIRETLEEIGDQPIEVDPSAIFEDGDFTAFGAIAAEAFEPVLNDEHTAAVWADLSDLPEPMHPGSMVDQLLGFDPVELEGADAAADAPKMKAGREVHVHLHGRK